MTEAIVWVLTRFDQTWRWLTGRCRPHCADYERVPGLPTGVVRLKCRRCGETFDF